MVPCASASETVGLGRSRPRFAWYLLVGAISLPADLVALSASSGSLCRCSPRSWSASSSAHSPITHFAGTWRSQAGAIGGRTRCCAHSLALVGLVLTVVLVTLFIAASATVVAARLIATPIAPVWNYLRRRLLVSHPEMPPGVLQSLFVRRDVFDAIRGLAEQCYGLSNISICSAPSSFR